MLRSVDRHIIRVPNLQSAVRYYGDVLGLRLLRLGKNIASFGLSDDGTELILHADPDQPDDAIYYLVDDVRDLYARRKALKLNFVSPPSPASRGYRAVVKDPFGHVWLLLDRSNEREASSAIEDAKAPGALF